MRKLLISLLTIGSLTSGALLSSVAIAEDKPSVKKTKRVPAMRAKVYSQLARAQKLADEEKPAEALTALDNVSKKRSSMNSYEIAMMNNFYAFIYYNQENYGKAIEHFEYVVAEEAIPESLRLSTIYSLSQLAMMQGDYTKTIRYIKEWMSLAGDKVNEKAYVLLAQAYYQQKEYQSASVPIDKAIALVDEKSATPDENWLILQRAVYYELKQPNKVTEILERMVKFYDKPKYWLQLANMYGEIGNEKEQLAIMETAFQRGFVESKGDLMALSQLYVFNEVPYKGAKLMQKAIETGVVEKNSQNMKFVAQSLVQARENESAIPVLKAAAALSDDNGNLDAELAQTLLNLQRYDDAINAANSAFNKGQLDRPGITHLVKGMSHFNLKHYDKALKSLEAAIDFKESRKIANQWIKYVQSEKKNALMLAKAG